MGTDFGSENTWRDCWLRLLQVRDTVWISEASHRRDRRSQRFDSGAVRGLAKECRCAKTYPLLEELVKDDRIEAVFVATDAPGHARHCIEVLNHMMFETSCFRDDLFEMREVDRAGGFGKIVYAEGEYFHGHAEPLPSFKEWRTGLPSGSSPA